MAGFGSFLEVPDLRRRIGFTLGAIALFRVGAAIPIPGVNADAIKAIFNAQSNNLLGFLNTFSGGALGRFSIFSMGVMPYINASIILSLLQGAHVFPTLDRLAKEGELGRRKLNNYTRYLTLALGIFQSFGLTLAITKMPTPGNIPVVSNPGPAFYCLTVLTLVAGTIFVMWLGEQITESGIGNGVSLIIFAGIVERIPSATMSLFELVRLEEINVIPAAAIVAALIVVIVLVVWLETAVRRIPVQYAKRLVGRRMYGGSQSYLPLKVDQSGVIAVIFAISLIQVPLTIAMFNAQTAWGQKITEVINRGNWAYDATYATLIVFFCYFYNSVSINPQDLADNLKKSGGFIPGIRPGEPTAKHIEWVMERITLGGALAVAAIAVLPDVLRRSFSVPFFFGGTSLLIVVGVALDTMGQIEAQLIMRHYEGFMKKGRIQGRWYNIGEQTQA
jgi:preprotein translocase subunit SecY